MEKQKNIPELRFPEFDGAWERKKVGEIGINIIDGDRGTNYPNGDDFSNHGYCLFLNAKNVTKNGFVFIENSFITEAKDEILRKGKLQIFDIVLTTRGSVGHIAYYNNNISFKHLRINSGMVLIRTNGSSINPDYLYKYFNSNQLQNEISKISFGSAQPQLTVGEISKFKICYPHLPEQQKIASFLPAVDANLTQLKQKKALLEQYKKGIMQKIFSQEIRFKDENGKDYPKWIEMKLGEICTINTGKKDTQNKNDLGLYPFFVRSDNIERIDTYSYDGEAILTSGDGVGVGRNFHYINGKFDYHQREYCLHKFRAEYFGKFIFYVFSEKFYDRVIRLSAKNSVDSIRMEMISKMEVFFPSLPEQIKIANFLTALDEKINQCQLQLEKTVLYKKGLLQKMFC